MIRILVVTHCSLANSLLCTGRMICGADLVKDITAITIEEGENGMSVFEEKVKSFHKTFEEDKFLILADIVSATPFNICMSVFRDADYQIVTGVNLPMVIDAALKQESMDLKDLAKAAEEAGKLGVGVYSLDSIHKNDSSEEDIL